MPILNKVLAEHKIKVIVLHDQEFFDTLAIEQKIFVPFCQYMKYKEVLQSVI